MSVTGHPYSRGERSWGRI